MDTPSRKLIAPAVVRAGTAIAIASMLLAGCGGASSAAQTAAKVNKEEITVQQVDFELRQQRAVPPQEQEAMSRQVLERLIDQELTLQKAVELKLDRDPMVRQQLEAARRDIISRAYLERVGETVPRPTPADVEKYYRRNPALFRERRVYDIHEIAIEARPEQVVLLTAKVKAAKNAGEFVDWLKKSGLRFSDSQSVRAAEQLPLASLHTFAGMSEGQMTISPAPGGATVVVLQGARPQPVDLEHASPAIEQFLLNERKRDLIAQDLKSLRTAAQIQYLGTFAQPAPPARAASAVNMGVAVK